MAGGLNVATLGYTRLVQDFLPMELGGFEPPTSWVRSKEGRLGHLSMK